MKRIVKFDKKILLLSKRAAKEGDLVFVVSELKPKFRQHGLGINLVERVDDKNVYFSDGRWVDLKRAFTIKRIISFNVLSETKERAEEAGRMLDAVKEIGILKDRLDRESIIISKSDLGALISVLPDANLVGSKKLNEDALQRINLTCNFKKLGGDVSVIVEFEGLKRKDEEIEGMWLKVNGVKEFVGLRLGFFTCMGCEVKTYYWNIFPSIISDEAMEAMNSAVRGFESAKREGGM
jgi:hypothetical protein